MVNTVQKNKKSGFGGVVAGVAGAVAVAGVAVAAAIALKDKKTREKVKRTLVAVKDQAMNYVETLENKPEAKKIISDVKKVSKKVVKTAPGVKESF